MCTNCNEDKQITHICNECVENKPCDCPVKDLSTDCSVYKGEDLKSDDKVIIPKNTNLSTVIRLLLEYITTVRDELRKFLRIKNIGGSNEVFKGEDLLGRKLLRTLKSEDNLIDISTEEETINFEINRENLVSLFEKEGDLITIDKTDNIVTVSIDEEELETRFPVISNVGEGEHLVIQPETDRKKEYKVKSLKTSNTGEGLEFLSIVSDENNTTIKGKSLTLKGSDKEGTFELLKSIETNDTENTVTFRNIHSDNLKITEDEFGDLKINYPVMPSTDNRRQFYVYNRTAQPDEDGTLNRPYSSLIKALVACIGNGSNIDPEFPRSTITLLNTTNVSQTELDNTPILQGNLAVNTITLTSDTKAVLNLRVNTNFPFNLDSLRIQATENNVLTKDIYFTTFNLKICNYSSYGIIKYICNNTRTSTTDPKVELTLYNLELYDYYVNQNDYIAAKKTDGTIATVFGLPIMLQNTIPCSVPLIHIQGRDNIVGNPFVTLRDISFLATSQPSLHLKDTSVNSTNLSFNLHPNYRATNNLTTNGDYQFKSDMHTVKIIDSYFRVQNLLAEGHDTVIYNTSSIGKAGGIHSFFIIDDLNSSTVLNIQEHVSTSITCENYLNIKSNIIDPDISLYDFKGQTIKATSFIQWSGASITNLKTLKVSSSVLKNVSSPTTSGVKLDAEDSSVNGFEFSSKPAYASDELAKSAGLFEGHIYYNTTTNSLKRVV